MSYFIAENGQQRGPYTPDQLPAQGLRPDSLVWAEGMAQWQRADQVPALRPALAGVPPQPPGFAGGPSAPPLSPAPAAYPPQFNQSEVASKKLTAGLLGILLGGLGIHKFILGYSTAGTIMLLVSLLTCGFASPVMHVIGIVEGILYLTKTDEQFYNEYLLQEKQWF